jgi:alcohol dehydrogenase, propanol-preferring
MRAMVVTSPAEAETAPLQLVERTAPEPGAGEVLVRVEACGVCRTDLHIAEGDLAPHRAQVIPGHEVVGRVEHAGSGVREPRPGSRVGVAWLHRSCGRCRFCARGDENLCLEPTFTGWDVDGGYAEYVIARADFVYSLPPDADPVETAPLLCAGIIGYRAFARCRARPGARLGLFGFGGSAHIVMLIAG